MMERLPSDLDRSEGSYIWDSIAPVAIELTQAALWVQEALRRGFASTTFGEYLDLRCEEHGIFRRAAQKATGTAGKGNQLTITGTENKMIDAGLRVATPADPVTGTPSVEFVTMAQCVIGPTGSGYADIEAVEAGAGGNVPAGSVSVVVTPLPGVNAVINNAPLSGGADQEDDDGLLARFLQKVRNPSAGGNRADYINWAGEVAGVGGVSVAPVKYGNGTVSVAIIDTQGLPAGQDLVDLVQDYIAPPWQHVLEAEDMTVSGSGISIDDSQPDDSGASVKMVAGTGVVHPDMHMLLDRPGIWQARPRVKVSDNTGINELLKVEVWNNTTGSVASIASDPGADGASTVYRGIDLGPAFGYVSRQFYWNGSDGLELCITRLQSDTDTDVWVDQVRYLSTFSKDTGESRSPVGVAVFVEPAEPVEINVAASLTFMSGYDPAAVKASAEAAIEEYLKGLAFRGVNDPLKGTENDVRYARIANAILDTEGVEDYQNLLVNQGTANISIGSQAVAVKGTVTF